MTLPDHANLAELLGARLLHALPGYAAHAEMAPSLVRGKPENLSVKGKDARRAATLILLYPGESGSNVVLTKRRVDLRDHSGQISLPGGSIEEGESPEDAALREACEEIGVPPEAPQVLGRLTPIFIPPSGFAVWPVVALLEERPTFTLQEAEVESLIEAPLSVFLDDGTRDEAWRETSSGRFRVPLYNVSGHEVWGATAMILAEFSAVLQTA